MLYFTVFVCEIWEAAGCKIMEGLEMQVANISREFNPQNASNTLWEHATLARQPSLQVVWDWERRLRELAAELGSQGFESTLLATCFFCVQSPPVLCQQKY